MNPDAGSNLLIVVEFNDSELLIGPGKISAEQAKLHAETEFEKYRIIQDQLYESDFDRFLAAEQSVASAEDGPSHQGMIPF